MDNEVKARNDFHPLKVSQAIGDTYDYVAEFNVTNGTTNYDVRANEAGAFLNLKSASRCIIFSDQQISIRFNSTSNPAIVMKEEDSPWDFKDMLVIDQIYITNASGSTAAVRILLF